LFRHFWEFSEDKENSDSNTETCDGKVDILNIGKVVGVRPRKEELGGDEWADKGGNSIP
jgi:hypothetical protein